VDGAVAVPGVDTVRQDAFSGASVEGVKPNFFSLLRLKSEVEQGWTISGCQ
jgi:hypothetical protein